MIDILDEALDAGLADDFGRARGFVAVRLLHGVVVVAVQVLLVQVEVAAVGVVAEEGEIRGLHPTGDTGGRNLEVRKRNAKLIGEYTTS